MPLVKKMNHIKRLISEINDITEKLLGNGEVFFRDSHLDLTVQSTYELTFMRAVPWLYSLFFERVGSNLNFIQNFLRKFGYSNNGYLDKLNALRTYYNHSLNKENSKDLDKINTVHEFFEDVNNGIPSSEVSWKKCTTTLLENTIKLLESILQCLKQMQDDNFKEVIVKDWQAKRNHELEFVQVVRVFERTSKRLGLTFFDTKKTCQRNYDNWMKELKSFDNNENLEDSLAKIIEKELINKEHIPIDGSEIMEHFNLKEGQIVGKYLKIAHQEFKKNPCGKKELLKRVKKKTRG